MPVVTAVAIVLVVVFIEIGNVAVLVLLVALGAMMDDGVRGDSSDGIIIVFLW